MYLAQSPIALLVAFLAAAWTMVNAINRMSSRGVEGTVLGTVIMPYCSGAPNLIFVAVMAYRNGPGREVLVNGLVNNITNLSLLIALPGLIWALEIIPRGKTPKKVLRERRLDRLSLTLTLVAVLFFTAVTWALGRDHEIGRGDGIVLVAIFFFWQSIQLFDVMRTNIEKSRKLSALLWLDILQLGGGGALMVFSVDRLVGWLETADMGFVSYAHIGWLSGWLMVLPNAVPAFYYAARRRADIVYSSQVGDGHICIPLCIGLFALFRPIAVPAFFTTSMGLLCGLAVMHLVFVGIPGRLPRPIAAVLLVAYAVFLYTGLIAN